MKRIVLRHFHHFERWSSILLAMGLGHWLFSMLGEGSILLALGLIVVAAMFRAWLGMTGRRPTI